MRILQIQLTNYRGVDSLTLDLRHPDGEPLPIAAIVGPNGCGKSSILHAVIACLTSVWAPYGGAAPQDSDRREGEASSRIDLTLQDTLDGARVEFTLSLIGNAGHRWFSVVDPPNAERWLDALSRDTLGAEGLVVGFDAHRIVPPLYIDGVDEKRVTRTARGNALAPSLRRDRAMWFRFAHLEQWLVNLDHLRARAKADEGRPLPLWDLVRQGLDEILAPVRFEGVDDSLQVRFRTPRGSVPLRALSDGFKSVFVIVAELVLRLSLATDDPFAVFDQEAVCLVDEVDAHLHPRWQQQVLRGLQQLFPRVQFIVTTHSPYAIARLSPHEVFLLGEVVP